MTMRLGASGAHVECAEPPSAQKPFAALRQIVVFFVTCLALTRFDAGHGWLIFSLPLSEAAIHPAARNERPELYLMCDDLAVTMAELQAKGVSCGPVHDERWGLITTLSLPSGNTVGLYQPKHPRPARNS
jgi:hypothetical protein